MVDEGTAISSTKSNYCIVTTNQNDSRETHVKATMPSELRSISRSDWITVAILCFINLINYMDRFTIAGEFCYITYIYLNF